MALPDKQVGKNKHFIQSARHALDGLKVFFVDENNFKREFLSATLVIVAGVVLQVSAFSWFVLVLAILLVFLGELLNTIVENVVDFIRHPFSDGHNEEPDRCRTCCGQHDPKHTASYSRCPTSNRK